ncbi:hypothetical protein ACYFX5_19805 [Bremerella sp. T1]|uniref:hypothetical protein n=1 Tax=Bremerella sp. TYQ1 TaxID=3119568 RepID=UPI001CCFC69D|nr:hypothetical protein [Bremerella volcania]UBM35291.1 hypothetical protein LA756_21755 [Bremerella volcania]
MRVSYLIISGIFITVASFMAVAQEEKSSNADTLQNRLHELRTERRDTLAESLDLLRSQLKASLIQVDVVYAAEAELVLAELELTPDSKERSPLHNKRIYCLRQKEEFLQTLHQAGKASENECLEAKAERIQAEIEFLEEGVKE